MRFKPIKNVKEDEKLGESLFNDKSQILLKKNAKLTQNVIDRVQNMGFQSLYVKNEDEEEHIEEELKDIIRPELRRKAIYETKESFEDFFSQLNKQKQQLVYGASGANLIKKLDEVSESLIDEIMSTSELKISIMDIKSESNYLYEHAINTAVLAITLSVKMGLNMTDIRNVAIGALLINLGYKDIPSDVYNHANALTEAQWEEIKKHPRAGYEILSNNTHTNPYVKTIVLQHHERINGSGYPYGILANEISNLSKIVMIADVYDAMTSDQKHRLAYPHNEVLEYIMANAGKLFDFDIAKTFSRCVVPYPAGAYVVLSDGAKAVVLKNNESHPLRPVLRRFKHGLLDNSEAGYVDLLEQHNLTILKIVYE